MPAGPIGETWAPGSWADTAWEEGSWGDSGAVVIDLLPEDASMLILRPRHTLYALAARKTLHRLPHRNTLDELGTRVKLNRIPHRNTVDGEG